MPSITFSLKDLQELVGKKISITELENNLPYCKADIESYDKEKDEVKIGIEDTNLPYMWSVEGIARSIKRILGLEKGIAKIEAKDADYVINVDKSVSKIRPYICAIVAKGKKIDEYMLTQLIQLQEKLCDSYGRRRKKVAIGIYSYSKIKFPVIYKAVKPESIKFVPLEYKREMDLKEITEEHPKGKEFAHLVKDFDKYPILIDSENDILSFPPIINSNYTGKIEVGDDNFFIEATGDDLDALKLAINIFAQAFYDRGYEISKVTTKYETEKITCPFMFKEKIEFDSDLIEKKLGIKLKENEIKELLEKAGYNYEKGKVEIPHYRRDILHQVDIIEDIGIMYGYDNIEEEELKNYTIGKASEIVTLNDNTREILIGHGFQEIFSPILSNKNCLIEKMELKENNLVEIEKFMSETYSVLRNALLPIMLECLSKNTHLEYPQKIFEEGLVSIRKGEEIKDHEKLCAVIADEKVDFTKIRQILDSLLTSLGINNIKIEDDENESFIPGRCGKIMIENKEIGIIGEISPNVLINFQITTPACAFEINLSELNKIMK